MNIKELDENWITPAALARELKEANPTITTMTITNWISRGKISFIVLPGAQHRRHLVDRRTAPAMGKAGRPRK